jgi:hypothetical protein
MTTPTYTQLGERWERIRAAEQLIYRRDKKISRARVRSVVAFLKGLRDHKDALGRLIDPRFDDMARTTEHFDRSSRPAYMRHVDTVCVARIEQLTRNGTTSVRIAAARTAVEFCVPGQSFDAVVKRLERAHRRGTKQL